MTIPDVERYLPRYTRRPFPAYRFVPGKAPHPTCDPDGHSYNKTPVQLGIFKSGDWQSCDEYLYGIDLFNHEYWWEAHEVLEAIWVAAGRRTVTGLFIQGLIQIAVAHLKWFQGLHDTASRMASEGLEKTKSIKGFYMGIDIDVFRSDVKEYFSDKIKVPVIITLNRSD